MFSFRRWLTKVLLQLVGEKLSVTIVANHTNRGISRTIQRESTRETNKKKDMPQVKERFSKRGGHWHFSTNSLFKTAGPTVTKKLEKKNKLNIYYTVLYLFLTWGLV